MSTETKLGQIQSVKFGRGGYQDVMLGVSVTLGGKGWGVCDFKGDWDFDTTVNERTKWTELERRSHLAEMLFWLSGIMREAKVETVDKLKGVPVEIVFENNTLKSWRILSEVL
jgi:hypothetical protein